VGKNEGYLTSNFEVNS